MEPPSGGLKPETEGTGKNAFCQSMDVRTTKTLPNDLEVFLLERDTGIGPASSAWEADILPLN